MKTVKFPEKAEAALNRLVELHPGKTDELVLVRALTFYHACYEAHLEGVAGQEINDLLDALDLMEGSRT